MSLEITATGAKKIDSGLWRLQMPPHQVRLFGWSNTAIGTTSVVLLKSCKHDATKDTLSFSFEDATALNIGTLSDTIAILASEERRVATKHSYISRDAGYAPGDNEFLVLCDEVFDLRMRRAAAALLAGVRERSSGELKRGLARNFSETPDNFWYVIVQPRVQQLSITVRGSIDHFRSVAKLPIKDDRGNTLFKISGEEDVTAALDIIFHAKRKL